MNIASKGIGCVYLVTNLCNDKIYVGQTWFSVDFRWRHHVAESKQKDGIYFHNAIRYYGKDSFSVGLLGTATSQDALNALESLWILLLDATNRKVGYNTKFGGSNGQHTEKMRDEISSRLKKEWENSVIRGRRIEGLKKSRASSSYKRSMSEKSSSRWRQEDFKQRMVAAMNTPEAKKNRSNAGKLAWQNEDRKRLISEKMKQLWKNPEYASKRQESLLKTTCSPEYRENQRKRSRLLWEKRRQKKLDISPKAM